MENELEAGFRRTPGTLTCHLLWAEVALPPQPQPGPSTKSSGAMCPLRPFKSRWSLSPLPPVTVIHFQLRCSKTRIY